VPAEATIDGDTLLVRAAGVAAPVTARYAWANYPEGANLYNGAGLPASPFRTDHPLASPTP
jgi:sialate O-acetylesterase